MNCPKCGSAAYIAGACVICGYSGERKIVPEKEGRGKRPLTPKPVLASVNEWRCKRPGCGFTLNYKTIPPGRTIAKHYNDDHGPDLGVETHVKRRTRTVKDLQGSGKPSWEGMPKSSKPVPDLKGDGYCPTCGNFLPSDDEFKILAAFMAKGVAPQIAREFAFIAARSLRRTDEEKVKPG